MKCIACKNEIPETALICSVCGSYQSKWKNRVIVISKCAGFITILIAIIGYIISAGTNLYDRLFSKDDLEIIEFVSERNWVIRNSGGTSLYLLNFNVSVKGDLKKGMPDVGLIHYIQRIVKPGTFLERGTKTSDEKFAKEIYSAVQKTSKRTWNEINKELGLAHNDCFYVEWDLDSGPAHQAMKPLLNSMYTLKTDAALNFYSSKGGGIKSKLFPVTGILYRKISEGCRGLSPSFPAMRP